MPAPVNIVLATVGAGAVISALEGVKGALGALASVGLSASAALASVGKILTSGVALNENIEQQSQAFDTLLGSATAARKRIAELYDFAAETPFGFPEIVSASKLLQAFTKDALATGDGLRLVGDASAAVSAPLQATAMWMGRLYAALAGGQPLGEPLQNLTQLGLISNEVRTHLMALQGQALNNAQIMAVLRESFGFTTGAMAKQATTLAGLKSTYADTFDGSAAKASLELNEALKGMYQTLTKIVGSTEFQQFAAVFADKAAGIVDAVGIAASLTSHLNPIFTAEAAVTAGTIFAASFAPKIVNSLNLRVLDWATRADSIGQKFSAKLLAPLTGGLANVLPVGLAAAIATEVVLGIYSGITRWRNGQIDAANAGFNRLAGARKDTQSISSEADRIAAAQKLAALEKQTAEALATEESRLWKNDAALASFRQQLEQIHVLQGFLNSDWAQHQIAINQAAAAAQRFGASLAALRKFEQDNLSLEDQRTRAAKELADAEAANSARIGALAGKLAGGGSQDDNDLAAAADANLRILQAKQALAKIDAELAKKAEDQRRAQEELVRLAEQIAQLQIEMKPLAEQRAAVADRLAAAEEKFRTLSASQTTDAKTLKEADLARLEAKRALLSVDQQLAQLAAEQARNALDQRQLAIQRELAKLDADFAHTDAEKWAARKTQHEAAVTAAQEYLKAVEAIRDANPGDAQAQANVVSAQQGLGSAQGALAGVGPDPNSWLQQSIKGLADLRAEWGTLAQNIAGTLTGTIRSAVNAVSQSISGLILRTMTWRQALWNIAGTILTTVVESFVQMGVKWVAQQIMMAIAGKAIAAASIAAMLPLAMALSEIWAAPATLATIATFGGAAIAAPAEVLGAIFATQGLALASDGGYFPGDPAKARGIFHGDEFVFSAPAVKNLGAERLYALHDAARSGNLDAFASAGPAAAVSPSGGGAAADPQPIDIAITPLDLHSAIESWAESRRGRAFIANLQTGTARRVR